MQPSQRELETIESLLRAAPADEFELVHPRFHAGITGLLAAPCHNLLSSDRTAIVALNRAVLSVLLTLGAECTVEHLVNSCLVVFLVLFNFPIALSLQLDSVAIADSCGWTVG